MSNIPLSEHDLLSLEECQSIRDTIFAHQGEWIERRESFHSLGTAAYLDAGGGRTREYLEKVKQTNPVLMKNFAPLLKKVRDFIQHTTGDKAAYNQTYGLPGFHIFELSGEPGAKDNAPARAHFDLQYLQAIPGYKVTAALSFTLPIEEPTGGSCLEVWPLRYADHMNEPKTVQEFAATHPYEKVEYQRGRLVLHDGLSLHAIGRARAQAQGWRITLQGHGVLTDDGWMLYW
jgi:hypothetical protein